MNYRQIAAALSQHPGVMVVERSDPSLELTAESLAHTIEEALATAEAGEEFSFADRAYDAAVALRAVLDAPEDASRRPHARYYLERLEEALRAQPPAREEAPAPTCQKCGGEIAGWCCQNCPAEFRENDDGVLIFDDDSEAPAEAGERLLRPAGAKPTRCYCPPDRCDAPVIMGRQAPCLRAQPPARPWGWDYEICTGCSASLTMADIKASGKVSCCPDRRMVTVRELVDAYDARRKEKPPLSPPPPPPSRG
jgi:hypothetical protein